MNDPFILIELHAIFHKRGGHGAPLQFRPPVGNLIEPLLMTVQHATRSETKCNYSFCNFVATRFCLSMKLLLMSPPPILLIFNYIFVIKVIHRGVLGFWGREKHNTNSGCNVYRGIATRSQARSACAVTRRHSGSSRPTLPSLRKRCRDSA